MIYLVGFLSRGTNTIHSSQAEDSISSGSLDRLQDKEKLQIRIPQCKHLHTATHPTQAAAETKLLRELRLSSSWLNMPHKVSTSLPHPHQPIPAPPNIDIDIHIHRIGQKVRSDFSITSYRKTRTFLYVCIYMIYIYTHAHTHTDTYIRTYIYPPLGSDQEGFRKNYIYTYIHVCLHMVISIVTLKDSNQYITNPFDLTTKPFP